MNKMKPEIKQKWIEELRNPNNKQNFGRLHFVCQEEETFCALGVLGNIFVNEFPFQYEWSKKNSRILKIGDEEEKPMFQEVNKWANIDVNENPRIYYPPLKRKVGILALNDAFQLSFAEIADLLEQDESV